MRCDADENISFSLKSLRLRNFRNFERLDLEIGSGVSVVVGNNGEGKTSLLESLSFLLRGKSFRPIKGDNYIRYQQEVARIEAHVSTSQGQDELVAVLQGVKKSFSMNQKRLSVPRLQARFPSVIFSPESLAAIKQGPELRRDLIDDFLLNSRPASAIVVEDFRRCLLRRNRLLRDFKKGLYSQGQIEDLIAAFDEIYLPAAVALTWERILALRALFPHLSLAVNFITAPEPVDISVDYEISSHSAMNFPRDELAHLIGNRLKLLRNMEFSSGLSLVGPHKHDIAFLSAGNNARYFCSQGQQRAIILGFKMAQIMYHYEAFNRHPLLLLDDVLSELDPMRGRRLLKFLEGVRSQMLLTTTDLSFPFEFDAETMAILKLESGSFQKLRTP